MRKFGISVAVALVVLIVSAHPVSAHASDVFFVQSGDSEITCGRRETSWLPGRLGKESDPETFKTYDELVRGLRTKMKKLTGNKKAKNRQLISTYTTIKALEAPVCLFGPPPDFGTPSLPPGSVTPRPLFPTPTPPFGPPPRFDPTATPSAGPRVFDSSGNVTLAGKTILEIPQSLAANIDRGQGVYLNNCVGCHIERTGRTFTDLRTNTSKPPMFFDPTRLPDTSLADLTAYLNRFRN